MRAVVVADTNKAAVAAVDPPAPAAGEILVRVQAAGLNRADLLVLEGHRHGAVGGVGAILGLECAGEVEALGPGATGFAIGDRVMCSARHAMADFVVTDAGRATRMPDGLGFVEAATLPVALQTMHNAIVTVGGLRAGQSVLVQGASSGVGLMALQIARQMGAGLVIGTSGDADRRARLTDFGAHLSLDAGADDYVEQIRAATGGAGVDLVIDQVSGKLVNSAMRATRVLGRIVNVGRLGGMTATFDFDLHALRRIDYVGVTFRTRSVEEIRDIVRAMQRDLLAGVASGALRLPIFSARPLAEADDAFAAMRANAHFGKIALTF